MAEETNKIIKLRHLERRDWQLWSIAILVIVALTISIVAIQSPLLVETPEKISAQLKIYLFGLPLFVVLFCAYVVQNVYILGKLKRQLSSAEQEKVQVQSFLGQVQERTGDLLRLNEKLEVEILERKRAEERLEHLALHDGLTNLPNRSLFIDRLGQALSRAPWHKRLVAVLFLDLDHFKRINDTLGHTVGDLLLKAVAERLTQCVRDGDTVARLGGDEFTIVLADLAQAQDIPQVAQKILDDMSKPFIIERQELFITTSIGISTSMGISLFPDDAKDAESLLKNADAGMYLAKQEGRNNYRFYSPDMNAKASQRLALETALRHAQQRDEFLLHYQPQVDLETGRVIGMEALLRWNHPELGLVSPTKFIPLAEETGLIMPIGEWVLRTACAQNKAWQEAGLPPIHVAVNLSARQFQEQDMAAIVSRVLKDTGLSPRFLELELTESILMKDVERIISMLCQLDEMGVRLSIDDFGTGYSSLNYLKRFPIDKLKVDMSFVRGITSDDNDAAIVTAIVTLAHTLKLKAVAEGVETEEQLEALRLLKCDEMQGYLFSRPLPAEEATKLLAEERHL